ncbi:MAG: methylmalonyl Co-A mutase-associated GTPase MeaB [Bacteroidia bacterium]|nr:methylmalonyl Co-A mutase-associated GTPase MeaB [Bacteroidia bacterium]
MSRKRLDTQALFEGIRSGDKLLLSRAITLVESSLPIDQVKAQELLAKCLPHTGRAFKIGITGVPGVGKSTFIDSFGTYLSSLGKKIAILTIDPSSVNSRGSILGDKTRMNRLSHDPMAFIRPSPTAGTLGGVASKTREAMLLCDAAGFDLIIVETVGVGQSETLVRDMVDFFLLLMLPNAGDELQGIKKGIMEMADAIGINKSDGRYLEKARQAKVSYSQALRLFPIKKSQWRPKTFLCSGLEGKGMDNCLHIIEEYHQLVSQNGFLEKLRGTQKLDWFQQDIKKQLLDKFFSEEAINTQIHELEKAILENRLSPKQAASTLINNWISRFHLE